MQYIPISSVMGKRLQFLKLDASLSKVQFNNPSFDIISFVNLQLLRQDSYKGKSCSCQSSRRENGNKSTKCLGSNILQNSSAREKLYKQKIQH